MKRLAVTSTTPSQEKILSDIHGCLSTVPKIIDDILAYNAAHSEERLEFDSLGKNHDFLVRCANDLNTLHKTKKKKAEKLVDGLRSALSRDGRIIFNVWCDVSKILDGTGADYVSKKPKKR